MNRLERLALGLYPPSFRARYGSELAALLEDTGRSPRATLDLVVGALRAWLRPALTGTDGPRRRLQASVATTWVAWCAGFLITPAVNRALLDPPTAGATGVVRSLLGVGEGLFFLGWALALLGAIPLIAASLLPAIRRHDWRALRPLLPIVLLGILEVGGALAITAIRVGDSQPGLAQRVALALWLMGFAALVGLLGLGPALSIERLGPPAEALRASCWLTLPLALTLTAATGCALAAAAIDHDGALFWSAVPLWMAIGVAVLASLAALTSSLRGTRALIAR